MTNLAIETKITKTVKKQVTLSDEQVAAILTVWALNNYGMVNATVDFDIAYDGFIRDVIITSTETEESAA